MSRHVVRFLVLWAVLAVVGEVFALQDFYPVVGAKQADDFDWIFRFLLLMGMPVFAFVVAGVVYAFVTFRAGRAPEGNEGGPTYRGTGLAPKIWLGITASLALFVMVYPGLTGLAHMQADKDGYGWGDPNAPLVVDVSAFRFSWIIEYQGSGVTATASAGQEMVLPVDREVTFRVHSSDVVHSMWIPAFRMKIDAIPGRQTFFSVTPTRLGSFDDDDTYRVQCAELCGVDHTLMRMPIRVVEQPEFDSWLRGQQQGSGGN